MSISNAMQAAVAGLTAGAQSVGKISENIANTATVGYKRSFADLVTTTGGGGSGVRAEMESQISLSGTMMSTSSATDLAVSGEGYFLVSKNPNDPVEANYFLTRAGSFVPDENGNLKNAAGYYLAGFTPNADGTLGAVDYTTVESLSTVNVASSEMTAAPSTTSSLTGNLPADQTGTGVVLAPFNSTMRYTNSLGGVERLMLSWQPSDATANLWTVTIAGQDGTTYGTVDVTFSDSGATPGAPASFAGAADAGLAAPAAFVANADGTVNITINNGTVPQTITLTLGGVGNYTGVTQFAGDYTTQVFEVDGSEASTIASTELDDKGTLWGVYENGDRRALYTIPLATVANPDGMSAVDGNAYKITKASGNLQIGLAGSGALGEINDYSLEQSNVDVAKEMTDLIQIQRYYSSNTKIVTTADEMLQEVGNMKR